MATARQAFKEGDEAENRGDLAIALAKFKEALAFKATPQLHLRIGAVQEKSGRLVDALDSYETGLSRRRPSPPSRRSPVRSRSTRCARACLRSPS